MRYTLAQVKEKIKLNLGYGIVQVELLDQHITEAVDQALDLYDEYFTNVRYKTINVSEGSNVFELDVIAGVKTDVEVIKETDIIGTIAAGTTSTTLIPILNVPVLPKSCLISIGAFLCTDDGNGTVTGSGLASGTIDYTTGQITVELSAAATSDLQVSVAYKYKIIHTLEILDVLSVDTIDPIQERQALTAYGIFDRTGIVMNKLTETAATYYEAMRGLADQANLFGSGLNWQYYAANKTLFLYASNAGAVNISLAVRPAVADIASENTGSFMKLATAKTKEILGRVRSKYKGVEIPGGTLDIDGDTLLAESEREISEVLEMFKEKRNPTFVVIK